MDELHCTPEVEKYEARENNPKVQKTKKGTDVTIYPASKWSVVLGTKVVCNIPDYHKYAEGIAEGIAEVLNNQNRFKLPVV